MMQGPTLAVLALRGEMVPDAVSLKSVTDGSETRMCGAPGGSSDVGSRLPRRAAPLPPPIPCCLANVCSAACSACHQQHRTRYSCNTCLVNTETWHNNRNANHETSGQKRQIAALTSGL